MIMVYHLSIGTAWRSGGIGNRSFMLVPVSATVVIPDASRFLRPQRLGYHDVCLAFAITAAVTFVTVRLDSASARYTFWIG
jgi:hypothetical protein